MAFDGITIRFLTRELEQTILGGRIDKIYQVEADEMLLSIRTQTQTRKLLLSASPNHARLQLSDKKYETPLDPPLFCMVMRKHFLNGKITGIHQVNYDRIVQIEVETRNDLGDIVRRQIVLEMMGKHSNLMLVDEEGKILDAIRHVTQKMSSVRTVIPGQIYTLPTHNVKLSPEEGAKDEAAFDYWMSQVPETAANAAGTKIAVPMTATLEQKLVERVQGLSPSLSREIVFRSRIEGKKPYGDLSGEEKHRLFLSFSSFMDEVASGLERFAIYQDKAGKNVDFSAVPYQMMEGEGITRIPFGSLSELMDVYYEKTDTVDKMRQKSQDLRHFLTTNLERASKKLVLQKKQLEDTKDRDQDRLYGDLITANLYQIKEGTSRAELINYYDEAMPVVVVKLDPHLSPAKNAQKFYARYNKLKRTEEALTGRIRDTEEEKDYLESMLSAVSLADCEQDIEDIREELRQTGYLKKVSEKTRNKKNLKRSRPLTFKTSENVEGRIGKNNLQNDELTFRMARPGDEWFHVKDMPGSHVILSVADLKEGKDYTGKSLLEAAAVAALYSKGAGGTNVPVDHTRRLYVKKPQGARPGFVTYTHQETIFVKASLMEEVKTKVTSLA